MEGVRLHGLAERSTRDNMFTIRDRDMDNFFSSMAKDMWEDGRIINRMEADTVF